MELLFDLIIFLIKQATKPSAPRAAPMTQDAQRQQAMLQHHIKSMQKDIVVQQSRTRAQPPRLPGAGRGATAPATVRAVAPPARQREVPEIAAPLAVRRESRPAEIPALRLPFLLGEVLSVPVALREQEF